MLQKGKGEWSYSVLGTELNWLLKKGFLFSAHGRIGTDAISCEFSSVLRMNEIKRTATKEFENGSV